MKTGNLKFNFSNSLNVQRSSRNVQFDSYNSRTPKHKKMLSHCTLRGWNLPWRYLDMCSFSFCQVATVKIAKIYCIVSLLWANIGVQTERASVFTAGKVPFCWNLIRQAFLLHLKDFRMLMIADLLYGIPILAQNQGQKDTEVCKEF